MTSHDFNVNQGDLCHVREFVPEGEESLGEEYRLLQVGPFFSICPSLFPSLFCIDMFQEQLRRMKEVWEIFCNPQISKWLVYGCLAWFREFLSFTFCVSFLPWEQMQNNSLLTWNKHLSILKYYFVLAGRTDNEKERIFFSKSN